MQPQTVRVNGNFIFLPSEKQWDSMDYYQLLLVKKIGGMIDIQVKFADASKYNSMTLQEKVNKLWTKKEAYL